MAIYYVALSNPHWPVGTYVEDQGDGFVQQVRMRYEDGHYHPGGWSGLCIPTGSIRSCLVRIQKHGFDQEIRRASAD